MDPWKRLPKLYVHAQPKLLPTSCMHTRDHVQLQLWRCSLIWYRCTYAGLCCVYIPFPASVLCVHKQLPGCTVANINTKSACKFKPLLCGISAFTQDSRPAIMLLTYSWLFADVVWLDTHTHDQKAIRLYYMRNTMEAIVALIYCFHACTLHRCTRNCWCVTCDNRWRACDRK